MSNGTSSQPGQPALDFWFDYASTYSYLAAARIERHCAQAGVLLRWKPFLLGPIFASLGMSTSPFNLNPQRGRHMWIDVARCAAELGLPFRRPSQFPRNSVLATRVALIAHDADFGPAYTDSVYRANFVDDRDIADPAVIRSILTALGQPGEEILALAVAEENKPRLRARTEEAARLQLFGAPDFIVEGELFFGNDRMEQATRAAAARRGCSPP